MPKTNIWEHGILCDVSVGWRSKMRARLDVEDIDGKAEKVTTVVRLGSKDLFEEEMLTDLKEAEGAARAALRAWGKPFPVGGAWFVPNKNRERMLTELRNAKVRFEAARDAFLDNYEANKDTMLAKYPEQLSVDDYPNAEDLKFKMSWVEFTLAPADENASEKIRSVVDEFVQDTIKDLREKVAEVCATQLDRLASGKNISDRQLKSLKLAVSTFDALNFAGDEDVAAALTQLREQLQLRSGDELKKSESARDEMKRVLDLTMQRIREAADPEVVAGTFGGRSVEVGALAPEA